ncbi:SUMF1/EgtB/PvdO family nonheme iron enzyme [Pedobacter sp. LMG 31464]|uniref:SUMF1/EgtB/PvdO family nonheme iron enzyme n=1 Tax=Pedobacter planticolens TaxID=2679964 RepID=A0A923IX10_9SPHI|nr:SUMF1/EgtB/PvdO family nonheme iron enzyme [Pedobacter planticolens]MBB2146684.1 SUMF1/EgtB/PvdO family nonheme iron enzyme [Pedobacter planticolens]
MRKIYFLNFLIITSLLMSCKSGQNGELVGAYNKKFKNKTIPYGMVFIPPGRTLIGMTDEDISFYQGTPSRMTSFAAFYMDQTEITNAEYRQFVNWVRDSVAVTSLGRSGAPNLYMPQPAAAAGTTASGQQNINWKAIGKSGVLWGKNSAYKARLQNMYYSGNDALPGKNEFDIRKFRYAYSYLDHDLEAAGRNDPSKSRQDFIQTYTDNPTPGKANEHPSVSIYPDTLVWKLDFSYAQNDPMVDSYFNHPSYDGYPVVGVTWDQATAFCNWRTVLYRNIAAARKQPENVRLKYRLPTDQEFEYAARGGRTQTKYPWGGPYIKNTKGCLQANFKVGRGNYTDDGGLYTVDARAYIPNDYGLYNMAGNVAEWTVTAYNRSATSLLSDFSPNYVNTAKGAKVVRGGSWKDIGFFLQNSVGTYEYQDKARSYIGFRCVSDYPGNALN